MKRFGVLCLVVALMGLSALGGYFQGRHETGEAAVKAVTAWQTKFVAEITAVIDRGNVVTAIWEDREGNIHYAHRARPFYYPGDRPVKAGE